MRRNRVENVYIHRSDLPGDSPWTEKRDDVYLRYLRRRMEEAGLTPRQKQRMVEEILVQLEQWEPAGP